MPGGAIWGRPGPGLLLAAWGMVVLVAPGPPGAGGFCSLRGNEVERVRWTKQRRLHPGSGRQVAARGCATSRAPQGGQRLCGAGDLAPPGAGDFLSLSRGWFSLFPSYAGECCPLFFSEPERSGCPPAFSFALSPGISSRCARVANFFPSAAGERCPLFFSVPERSGRKKKSGQKRSSGGPACSNAEHLVVWGQPPPVRLLLRSLREEDPEIPPTPAPGPCRGHSGLAEPGTKGSQVWGQLAAID